MRTGCRSNSPSSIGLPLIALCPLYFLGDRFPQGISPAITAQTILQSEPGSQNGRSEKADRRERLCIVRFDIVPQFPQTRPADVLVGAEYPQERWGQ